MKPFTFELNGVVQEIGDYSPNMTLLQYLRRNGWTGTKEGCAEGDCGACSVALLDQDPQGKAVYRAINSCLVPLASLAGRAVLTVEGVSSKEGKLHPVQEALVRNYGSQCGYCTPGIVVSLFEAFYRKDLNEEWQLDDQLCGNLCRCTGYRAIRDAAFGSLTHRGESSSEDPFRAKIGRLSEGPEPTANTVGAEKFYRPGSIAELLQLLRENPGAELVAGGTEVGIKLTKLFKKFPVLISLEGIRELKQIEKKDDEWRVGAGVTLTNVWQAIGDENLALATMFRWFGSRQIRNRATFGGNLVTASPIGDSAPVLLALDAEVEMVSEQGERRIRLADFFAGYRNSVVHPIRRGARAGSSEIFEYVARVDGYIHDLKVTSPISTKFIAAPKAKFVRAESMFGKSFVYVIFRDGADIYWARSRVIEYLNSVRDSLPFWLCCPRRNCSSVTRLGRSHAQLVLSQPSLLRHSH
jgi:xanthine dehydrogenase small subunit